MNNTPQSYDEDRDLELVEQLQQSCQLIRDQLNKVIVGQNAVIEEILMALFARGHCLLVGVPGLAKTLLVRTLAQSLSLDFRRIQFTPDLMPTDITGTEVIQEDRATGTRQLRFLPGPIFAHILLADEINRTPPKTQAALLEAMQEQQVTVGGQRHPVPQPFFVLATQNPIEQEGTYPLPEAQLDRFMLNVLIDYPDEDEELQIVQQTTTDSAVSVQATLTADDILALAQVVRRVPVADHIARYAVRLARRSRPTSRDAPEYIQQYIAWGAGPRASQNLVLAAKARAVLRGRYYVTHDDIRSVAAPVLRHRLRMSFRAEADGITADQVVTQLISLAPTLDDDDQREELEQVFRPADIR